MAEGSGRGSEPAFDRGKSPNPRAPRAALAYPTRRGGRWTQWKV